LSCAMTHIDPRMKEDLLFLDVLVQNCNSALAKDSHKILLNFLGMYVVVNCRKLCTGTRSIMLPFVSLDEDMISIDNCEKETLSIESYIEITILSETAALLKNIVIMQFIVEYIDMKHFMSRLWYSKIFLMNSRSWNLRKIIQNWCDSSTLPQLTKLLKTLFLKAGLVWYSNCINLNHTLRLIIEASCLPISCRSCGKIKSFYLILNHGIYVRMFGTKFGICQIHVWFTSLFNCNEQFPKSVRSYCISILKYYMPFLRNSFSGIIENWCDSSTLPQLTKLLKTLFLKAGPVWYSNCIHLNHTLRPIEASSRLPMKEPCTHLGIFQSFITILPSLFLKPSIDDIVIRMIS
ncbi:hypothetical protein ALC57_15815, partial [Trachymyrmex cornetzi]